MAKKILCPFHKEETPSCNIYSNGFFCFGCGARGPLTGLVGVKLPPAEELEPEPPEDLELSLAGISARTVPTKVRGLTLPADARGYYLIWPDKDYYKLRVWEPGKGPKYLGARGHRRPLYWARRQAHSTLLLVEGEINALSLLEALKDESYDIVSPGGCGDFTPKKIREHLPTYLGYDTIIVVADGDKAGAEAIINALSVFWANKINAVGLPMTPDANEMLVNEQQERIRDEIERSKRKAMEGSLG